jgi:type VI secretion system protein ImpH
MPSPKDKLAKQFFEFDFFQAIRVLERLHPDRVPVGLDGPPAREIARFRAHLSMAFPPSQIIALDAPDEERPNPLLTVTFFGLYGPSGVLPTHYTQLLMDLVRDVRGPERRSLRDWLDLFNHRFISLFYRAWEKYRFHLAYDRGEATRPTQDTFTLGIRSLMGLGTPGHRDRLILRNRQAPENIQLWDERDESQGTAAARGSRSADKKPKSELGRVDDLALMYFAGFFVQRPRNAVSFRALLADYFRLPIEIRQFQGSWLQIPEDGQTRIGVFGSLGVNAVAGERTWDVQSRFGLRFGPLTYAQFEDLLPDPAPLPQRKTFFLAAQLARLYVGPELDFDIQLVLSGHEVPESRLGDQPGAGPRLGWNMWLISESPSSPVDDAVFDAEWTTVLG